MKKILLVLAAISTIAMAKSPLAPQVICHQDSPEELVLEFHLAGEYAETISTNYGDFVRYHIPTGGFVGQIGSPEIPSFSTLVASFRETGATVSVVKAKWDTVKNILIYPVQDPFAKDAFSFNPRAYERGIYPKTCADAGEPSILRDFRVIPINIYPFRYDAAKRELLIARDITLKVKFDRQDPKNPKNPPHTISTAFARIYQSVVANYWFYAKNANLRRATVLYIARDDFVDDILPLLDWRQMRGYRVRVARAYEDIGGGDTPSADDILDYIQNAYDTWEYPPDYVVLVGDVAMGGTFLPDYDYYSPFAGGESYASDYRYSLLEGDDYFADIIVGRISVDNEVEAQTYANKVVRYEAHPFDAGSQWLRRGAIIAANCCGTPQPTTPRLMSLWLRELASANGFAELDTFFCYGTDCPRGADDISAYLNEGVAFVNYRGWGGAPGWTFPSFYVGDVMGLSNVGMTPFVTSIVCGTGDFNSSTMDPAFCEAWIRAGTPTAPRGGVDFYGPSDHDTHTKWNNPNCEGFYWGYFEENLLTFGQCALRGKINLYLAYPDNRGPGDGVEHYFFVYNVIGDPSVNLWRASPGEITAEVPEEISRGATEITVSARRGTSPLDSALVSVWFYDGDPITILTGPDGNATVPLPAERTATADSFSVVISKPNLAPFIATVHITGEMPIVLADAQIDDSDGGNGDGKPSPGEQITFRLRIANSSGGTADNIQLRILPDTMYQIIDTAAEIPSLAEGETTTVNGIRIQLANSIPDSFQIPAQFEIRAGETVETSAVMLDIRAPLLAVDSIVPDGGILSPGESPSITVIIKNVGSVATLPGTLLASGGIRVIPIDSLATGPTIAPGETAQFLGIRLQVDPDLINGIVDYLTLEFFDGFYHQTITTPIRVGEITPSTFGGPDLLGYYCYDNTDTESGRAPEYDWIEISPFDGGDGTPLDLGDDETVNIPLPFPFNYYGHWYDTIGVCSNGWIGPGAVETWIFNNFYNRPLPDPSGLWGVICPFWDDLDPTVMDGHGVFYKYIEDQHIFVVEWKTVNAHDRSTVEWFEVILRNPAYYPAQADVGEIIFQYREISDIDSLDDPNALAEYSTVGIEDPTKSVAIQYKFCGELAPFAADLEPGRAILFTTNPPVAIDTSKIEAKSDLPRQISVNLVPNPFNPYQTIEVSSPPGHLQVDIIDLSGRTVKHLYEGEKNSGTMKLIWNGTDRSGKPLPSGVYLVRIRTPERSIVKKTVLIR